MPSASVPFNWKPLIVTFNGVRSINAGVDKTIITIRCAPRLDMKQTITQSQRDTQSYKRLCTDLLGNKSLGHNLSGRNDQCFNGLEAGL